MKKYIIILGGNLGLTDRRPTGGINSPSISVTSGQLKKQPPIEEDSNPSGSSEEGVTFGELLKPPATAEDDGIKRRKRAEPEDYDFDEYFYDDIYEDEMTSAEDRQDFHKNIRAYIYIYM